MGDFCIDPETHHLFVSDWVNHSILKFDRNGTLVTSFGSMGDGWNQFFHPRGLTITGSKLFVCDYGNSRIQVFDNSLQTVDSRKIELPRRIIQYNWGAVIEIDRGILTRDYTRKANLINIPFKTSNYPIKGMCINSLGEIMVSGESQVYNLSSGKPIERISASINSAFGICTDRKDNIFVADNFGNKISIFTPGGELIREIEQVISPRHIAICGRRVLVNSDCDGYIYIFSN